MPSLRLATGGSGPRSVGAHGLLCTGWIADGTGACPAGCAGVCPTALPAQRIIKIVTVYKLLRKNMPVGFKKCGKIP
jgi:hypothetical protein